MAKQFEPMDFTVNRWYRGKQTNEVVSGYKLAGQELGYYQLDSMFYAIHLPTGLGLLTYPAKVTQIKNFLKGLAALPVDWQDVTGTNCCKYVMSNGVRLYDALLEVRDNTID